MNGLEPLIPVALFFSVASVIILRGPIGKAIADRIAGRASRLRDGGDDTGALIGELEEVGYRLSEVEERMDFAERLLTKHGDQSALPGGQ
jgi:hypothetical protein